MNTPDTTAVMGSSVEYDATEARVPIVDLIATLEDALEDGATCVVLASGNWRGPQWLRIVTDYDIEELS